MHVIPTYKHAGSARDQPFVLLLLCSVSTASHSDLIVCLTKGLGNSEIYLLVLDSLQLPTNWIRTLNCQVGPLHTQGRISLIYSIATFFLVIQPCLKISAEYFNEARGTADVPNEDDDRVYFTRRHTCTRG